MEQPFLASRNPPLRGVLLVLALAIVTNGLVLMSSTAQLDGDGPFYITIARNLAAGKGYTLGSFWPGQPTMGRAPVWPALLTIPAWLAPRVDDATLVRSTAICLNLANALLLFGISWALTRNLKISVAAGAGYAVYPVAVTLAVGGHSEIPYVFVAALGTLLALRGGRMLYAGALFLGLSALVRSSFILLPVMAGLAALPKAGNWRAARRFVALAALYWLPAAVWIARNYAVSGEFPVFSTIEGETLYGANNDYVASNLAVWGYWVFPNEIPGETAKKDLAATMTELQLDRYYHRKAIQFVRQHWFALPRLEVGKVIRGFVPVPWVPRWDSYCVFFFRAVLYAAIVLHVRTFLATNPLFRILVTGMLLVVVVTALIYYGTYRFTFCAEVFLLPTVAEGVIRRATARESHGWLFGSFLADAEQ